MIRVLMWKEYRDHRLIWLTMAVVNIALLLLLMSVAQMAGFGPRDDNLMMPLGPAAVLLVWAYGMLAGSMMLAGERETGTLAFLDILPVTRFNVWIAKTLIGLALLGGQVVVLSVSLAALRDTTYSDPLLWPYVLSMMMMGLIGLAWGLLFSAGGENVLRVIGMAILGQMGGAILAAMAAMAIAFLWMITRVQFGARRGEVVSAPVLIGACFGAFTLTAISLSVRSFSRTDRLRRRFAQGRRPSDVGVWTPWVRLMWLSWSQMRRAAMGLTVFSLLASIVMVLLAQPLVWPIVTLLLGVLCGVTVFGDEQMNGSFRFLGDQRFPFGPIWIVKTGLRFTLALVCALVLVLPSLILALTHDEGKVVAGDRLPFAARMLHSQLIGVLIPTGAYLFAWLLYGFVFGHLCGLLFRKSVVAMVLALGGASFLLILWLPSLVGIGLHFWQIAAAPLVLLTTTGLLVPGWAADRLWARGTFVGVGLSLITVAVLTGFGLWYRIAEVPDVPDTFDMPAFVAALPTPEENKAGQDIRRAWSDVKSRLQSIRNAPSENPLFLVGPPQPRPQPQGPGAAGMGMRIRTGETMDNELREVLDRGWPGGSSSTGDWLDGMFRDKVEWLQLLNHAADQPLGMVANPQQLTLRELFTTDWPDARLLALVLAVRGLQQQTRGDARTFVDHLRIGLTLSRNLQHCAAPVEILQATAGDGIWLSAFDRWLEKLSGDGQAELLARARQLLARHDAELPDVGDGKKTEYLVALNTLEREPEFLIGGKLREESRPEQDVAALLWRVPWEQARHRRILRALFQGSVRQQAEAEKAGGSSFERLAPRRQLAVRNTRLLCRLRVDQIQAALRLYQVETGKAAATLQALVPRYLPTIPLDPFDEQPLRYRLSKGERIEWPSDGPAAGGFPDNRPRKRFVPKGQGILWSVGDDRMDNGGVKQGESPILSIVGEDLIFLVPPVKP